MHLESAKFGLQLQFPDDEQFPPPLFPTPQSQAKRYQFDMFID